ncbi:hypothetical protein EDC01DRAFT_133112 [Geopyxis carbonaria]|nr:hypothetical protein EDC01DRAFT_133112 [Geopyxis carbonaria]
MNVLWMAVGDYAKTSLVQLHNSSTRQHKPGTIIQRNRSIRRRRDCCIFALFSHAYISTVPCVPLHSLLRYTPTPAHDSSFQNPQAAECRFLFFVPSSPVRDIILSFSNILETLLCSAILKFVIVRFGTTR